MGSLPGVIVCLELIVQLLAVTIGECSGIKL